MRVLYEVGEHPDRNVRLVVLPEDVLVLVGVRHVVSDQHDRLVGLGTNLRKGLIAPALINVRVD